MCAAIDLAPSSFGRARPVLGPESLAAPRPLWGLAVGAPHGADIGVPLNCRPAYFELRQEMHDMRDRLA